MDEQRMVKARTWASATVIGVVTMWGTLLVTSTGAPAPRPFSAWQPEMTLDEATTTHKANSIGQRRFSAGDYNGAVEAFERALEHHPEDPTALFMRALSLHRAGRYEEAKSAHREASAVPGNRAVAVYNLACAHALLGETDEAFDALFEALGEGFGGSSGRLNTLRTDPDLSALRADPRYGEALATFEDRGASAMDFWVGEWDCYNAADGKKAGTNSFTREASGHAILERWRGAGGNEGASWNHYNPEDKLWKQDWVGANGNVTEFVARQLGHGLLFVGPVSGPNGEGGRLHRMYVRPLGDAGWVRQSGSASTDEGATWAPRYDLVYVPRGEAFSLERLAEITDRSSPARP